MINIKGLLSAATGTTLLFATAISAQAATSTFDFTNDGVFAGTVLTDTADDGSTISARGFRYSFDGAGVTVGSRGVGTSVLGVGVLGFAESVQIDGFSDDADSGFQCFFSNCDTNFSTDLLVLELDSNAWTPESISFGLLNPSFDDYAIYGYDAGGVSGALSSASAVLAASTAFVELENSFDQGNPVNNPYEFEDGVGTFQYLIVSAISTDPNDINQNDFNAFSVTGFSGTTAVPLPAALPLLASAFAGFGIVSWRRRRNLTA